MTVQDHIAKMQAGLKALDQGKPLAIAAQTVHALRVVRIFDKEGTGGTYNKTRPLYVADKNLRRAGSHRGKTGKPIKTTAFPSYYALKRQQGFNPDIVNMRLTNDLQSDFANAPQTNGTNTPVGPLTEINKNLYVEDVKRPNNIVKLKSGIKKYGDFTKFTKSERAKFAQIVQFEFMKVLNGK